MAHNFRYKLRMRQLAEAAGIAVPRFSDLNESRFLEEVPPDWILKPTSKAGSKGISRVSSREQLHELLQQLGEEKEHYLLEQDIAGDVFHVDSIVFAGRPVFSQAHRYDTPPFEICDRGGVFSTRSLGRPDPGLAELLALNREVMAALQLRQGVTHAEFIRCRQTGRLYFLEIAARVGLPTSTCSCRKPPKSTCGANGSESKWRPPRANPTRRRPFAASTAVC